MPTLDRDERQTPLATTRLSGRRRFPRGKFSDHAEGMTAEEWEFAQELQAYKERNRNFFPTSSEVLKVLKSLGYRRVAAAQVA